MPKIFQRKFLKHLLVTDGLALIGLLFYNLLALVIPLIRLHFGTIILILLFVDLVLIILKANFSFEFGNRP